jgi:protein-S-isoprenylcysteine O-methyltransferase Ste14
VTVGRAGRAGSTTGAGLSGLALAVWARVYLGRNWGMPMSQKADPELVTTGPYWLIAVVVLGAYFLFSAVIEERTMAKLFPADYPPYKRATKMLIPYIL